MAQKISKYFIFLFWGLISFWRNGSIDVNAAMCCGPLTKENCETCGGNYCKRSNSEASCLTNSGFETAMANGECLS